ncbi:hypothetical protein GCM10011390_18840 [Aureimonas endophytica]|uniref:Homeodomain-like domain-containing protein n=1 Tax=Aureimonas endophytica TaxID=2027858 RepID=A0A917E3J2_9HYPH|nr:hypothetical protein [Aureimonas endophytica]GGE00261.1 hypothetical protein GCM10011390_18840 [Aureimonas endophytica]
MSGRWTDVEDEHLYALACDGVRHDRIGALLGRSPSAVQWRARLLGASSRRRRWTRRDDAVLRSFRSAGRSVEDIAAAMGRTPGAIQVRMSRLGIFLPSSLSSAVGMVRGATEQETA